jgi:uncharacterized protein (TIGR00297 family)
MPHPSKTISEARDRWQSRLLVLSVGGVLIAFAAFALKHLAVTLSGTKNYPIDSRQIWIWLTPWMLSLTFAAIVWAVRAATFGGIFFGALICLSVVLGTQFPGRLWGSGLPPLIALFLLTFAATRIGKRRKQQLGARLDADEKHGRSAAQVIANLGMAGLASITGFTSLFDNLIPYAGYFGLSIYITPVLLTAALSEATADTVSSEIGQAFGGTPFLLTTLRPAPAGTDGAVSLLGTAAGIASAAIVAAVAATAMPITLAHTAMAFAAGVAGLFFDSILGATVERKGWLGNDLVNFASTAFAVATALLLFIAFH